MPITARFGGDFSVESAKGQRSPMPIRQYLQGHRFDDETVRLLGIAYEMTLVALRQRREDDPLRHAPLHRKSSNWRKLANATRGDSVTEP